MDNEEERAIALLRRLDDEPGTPSRVDLGQAIIEGGRRRRTRRALGGGGAVVLAAAMVATVPVALTALRPESSAPTEPGRRDDRPGHPTRVDRGAADELLGAASAAPGRGADEPGHRCGPDRPVHRGPDLSGWPQRRLPQPDLGQREAEPDCHPRCRSGSERRHHDRRGRRIGLGRRRSPLVHLPGREGQSASRDREFAGGGDQRRRADRRKPGTW